MEASEQFREGSAGVERLLCEFGRNIIAKQWNECGRQCSARHQMFLVHIGVRRVFQGMAKRAYMLRMFDRHAKRPDRWSSDQSAIYAGEWFEIYERSYSICSTFCRRSGCAGRSLPCANS